MFCNLAVSPDDVAVITATCTTSCRTFTTELRERAELEGAFLVDLEQVVAG
jgi:hypothetical protein